MSRPSRTVIARLIAERSLQPVASDRLAEEIAAYLILERRTADLESLLRDIQEYRAENGILEVNAISAYKLDESTLNEIKNQLSELYNNLKKVIINQTINPDSVAGVRVEMANKLYDASVRTKLNHFRQLTTKS